jgi:putative oxidoreductase
MSNKNLGNEAHPAAGDRAHFSPLERSVAQHQDVLLLLARCFLAFIFIESALNHATNVPGFAQTFNNFQLPASMGIPVAWLAVFVELAGGLALLVGYRVRETTLLMILFVLVTIFVGHRFWELEGVARRTHIIQVKKNVAIIGGFLALLITGGGRFALSALRKRR